MHKGFFLMKICMVFCVGGTWSCSVYWDSLCVLALFPASPSLQTRGSVLVWLEEISAVFPLLFFPRVDFSHGGVEELFSHDANRGVESFLSFPLPRSWRDEILKYVCTLSSCIFHRTEKDHELDPASFLGCYWANTFIMRLLPVM